MWFITKGNFSWGVSHFGCSTDSDSLLLDKERNWSEKFLLMLRAIKGIVFPRWRISEGMVSRPPGKIRRFILCQLPDITENPLCVDLLPWNIVDHFFFLYNYWKILHSNEQSGTLGFFGHFYFVEIAIEISRLVTRGFRMKKRQK